MFKKLLSNLPYNPSLIGQVSFYAQRIHRESSVRRSGFVMIVLAMFIQMFAVISPSEASLQASPNTDLINGGFSSKQEAVSHCRNNTQNYKKIMNYFGVTCDNIADATVTNIKPRDFDGKLYSMGRLAYGVPGETPIQIPGAGTFYVRHFWSLNHDPSYKALKLKNTQGKTFFILFGCGNLVAIGIPAPPPPKDECDNIPGIQTSKDECDVCPNLDGIQLKQEQCDQCPNLPGTQNKDKCDVCPRKPGVQSKFKDCDVCPNKSGVQTEPKQCDVCPNIPDIQRDTSQCPDVIDVCPDVPGTQTDVSECGTTEPLPDACPNVEGTQRDESECKACEKAQTNNDMTACLEYKKTAKNITQRIDNANNTTAKPGDVIEYTLTTTNVGNQTIKDYQVSEGIADVLDYADVVDLHGGTKGEYELVTWPKQDIRGGASITNSITVKVKDVLPNTPASSSDPEHFDMVMTNTYGNPVSIKLPPSVSKQTEIAVTALPNTGPGTSLIIGFCLTAFIGYFFARSKLIAKELDVVRSDFGSAGGY